LTGFSKIEAPAIKLLAGEISALTRSPSGATRQVPVEHRCRTAVGLLNGVAANPTVYDV
jgi:hypothetical protein